ncbi:DUF1700 domain-containing protein [Spiroplasma taiwanense]|uniref:DUF1700 domain-containing protein n=1 Tax=Spiroplasma taiwanense CT-1 TaxID=1276220 RepID=S5LWN6_9MOLU|nr:hypothetical protein [Spiroplasma taiwanense]AGR41051.1 hypothetical protein STAIW_v1c04010 [Spiroplasma taiwanense CT-1]
MTEKILLPKKIKKWILFLKNGLSKLEIEDRDDILLSYTEQFSEEVSEGKSPESILINLRPIPIIVKEIYEEFNIEDSSKRKEKIKKNIMKVEITDNENNQEKSRWSFSKIFAAILSFMISLVSWTLTIAFAITAIITPISLIVAVAMSYINYDPYFGTSISLLLIAIVPFATVLVFFLTTILYKSSLKLSNFFKIRKNQKQFSIKFE